MRKKRVFFFLLIVMILFFMSYSGIEQVSLRDATDYYIHNFISDTAAHNAVTAIYLNYRVYDTLFETLTLLVSVLAIIHFSRHEGGEHEG
jgi:multisubunit Na+/H+ antiporter MnhB subunit